MIAIWIKRKNGLLEEINQETRPLSFALWQVAKERFPELWREIVSKLTHKEIQEALAPFGINVVLRTESIRP